MCAQVSAADLLLTALRLRLRKHWTAKITFVAVSMAAVFAAQANAQSQCDSKPLASGIAARVLDPRTILLSDGREVRLAGIALPSSSMTGETAEASRKWEDGARAALEQALAGQEISVRTDQPAPDRYGRWHAFAFVKRGGLERLLQHDMLTLGLALVAPRVGALGCARELLAAEGKARGAVVGIWSDAQVVRNADQPKALLMERGRLVLVESQVLSVRESGGTIYLNFGRRWSEDFTVTIPKRDERRFVAAGMILKALERRRVRVRGFIEERGGPWIEARYPEQIELLQD